MRKRPMFSPIPDERALAPVPPAMEEPVQATVFQMFLQALNPSTEDEPVRFGVAWADLLLEDIVLFGTWPIFERVAQRLGSPLSSLTQATDEVAPRAQRLIDAGLLRTYASPADAATAFRETVLSPLDAALQAAARGGEVPSFRALAMPLSFAFFAKAFAAGKALADELEGLVQRVVRQNVGEAGVFLVPEYATGTTANAFVQYLKILTDQAHVPFPFEAKENTLDWAAARGTFEEELLRLRKMLRLQAALRDLPTRLGDLLRTVFDPIEFRSAHYSIADEWLNTQLLLAAVDGEDAEHVYEHERVPMQEAAYALTDEVLLERLKRRLRARGWAPSLPHEALVLERARENLVRSRANRYRSGFELWHVIARLDVDALIRLEGATQLVTSSHYYDAAIRRALDKQRRSAADAVDWPSLDGFQVEDLIGGARLPIAEIVKRFPLLRPSVREACLPKLRAAVGRNRRAYSALVRLGYVRLEVSELITEEAFLTRRTLLRAVRLALHDRAVPGNAWMDLLFLLRARGLRKSVRALLARPELRREMVDLFMNACAHDWDCGRFNQSKLRALFGKVLWRRYLFACEIWARIRTFEEVGRGRRLQIDDAYGNHRWNRIRCSDPESSFAAIAYDRALEIEEGDFPRVLRVYSERRSFFWLYANEPDVEARWRAYVRGREAYFPMLEAAKARFGLVRDRDP